MVTYAPLRIETSRSLSLSMRASRRLPTVPQSPVSARPLPQVPPSPDSLMTCKNCKACIASQDGLLPDESVPATHRSRKFSGFSGPASLFTKVQNIKLGNPSVQLMATGAHTCQEITCIGCRAYLGLKIVRAHEKTERWKEGYSLLELGNLSTPFQFSVPPRFPQSTY